jgi:HPt (histidine-containing phosphotransfer) domain-containing protein
MRRLALLSALLLGASLGCRSKQTSNADANSIDTSITTTTTLPEPAASTAPRDFSFDERQQFTESIRQQLATADQQIEELAAQVKSAGGAVSDRALANIRATRKAADRDLRRVEAATAANWEQVQTTVNRTVDRLSESIEAAQPK